VNDASGNSPTATTVAPKTPIRRIAPKLRSMPENPMSAPTPPMNAPPMVSMRSSAPVNIPTTKPIGRRSSPCWIRAESSLLSRRLACKRYSIAAGMPAAADVRAPVMSAFTPIAAHTPPTSTTAPVEAPMPRKVVPPRRDSEGFVVNANPLAQRLNPGSSVRRRHDREPLITFADLPASGGVMS
jgi:hypothetical protein